MLASDFQNPGNRHDVNADRQVSPIDALLVINQLNATGSRPLSSHSDAEGESTFAGYIDTNGDQSLSPIDALLVINVLADFADNAASDEATPVVAASQSLGAVLGVSGGEVSLQATFDGDLPNVDEIGIYVVDQLDAQPDGDSPAWRKVAELPSRQPLWQRGSSRNLTAAPSFPAGQSIGVYVVQATGDASPASDHLQVTRQLDGSWVVGWEDSLSIWPATNLGTGRGFDDWRMTLTVADSNLPPEFQSEPITTANAAIPYVYDSEATDPDADPLAYKLMSGPTGMMVDEATGLIRWKPTPADIGFHQIAIEVSDGALTDLQTYDLQVGKTPSNRPPVITSEPVRIVYLDTAAIDQVETVEGELFYSRHTGQPNVKSASFLYDGMTVQIADRQSIASISKADGIVQNPRNDDLLIVGGGAAVHTVSKSDGAQVVLAVPSAAYHLELEGESTLYTTGVPGDLQRITIRPDGSLSEPTKISLSGDDSLITTLVSTPVGYFYTRDNNDGLAAFGRLQFTSGTSATTTRLITNLRGAHTGFFDPYSATIIFGGQSILNQLDLEGNLIASRNLKGVDGVSPGFDNGTIDGLGHLFYASSATGHLLFLDYSETGRIDDSTSFATLPFLESGLDDIAPLLTASTISSSTTAVYQYDTDAIDADGDFLTYELVADDNATIPDGMRIVRATGEILWTPTADQIGNHQIKVRVTDGHGGEAIQEYVLCVHPDPNNHAPIIISEPSTAISLLQGNQDPFTPFEIFPSDVGSTSTVRFSTLPTDSPGLFGFSESNTRRIDFDFASDGDPILHGTLLTDEYASLGLEFTNVSVSSTVFQGPASPPNTSYVPSGAHEFKFTVPVTAVGVINTSPDRDIYEFYSPQGDLIFSTADHGNDRVDRFVGVRSNLGEPIGSLVVRNNTGNLELDEMLFEVPQGVLPGHFSYDLDAFDFDNDSLEYRLESGPDGATINNTTGVLSWDVPSSFVEASGIEFSETTFEPARWIATMAAGSEGAASSSQLAAGGNDGQALRVVINVPAASSQSDANFVTQDHWVEGAVYNPQTQGPVLQIDYSQDFIVFNANNQSAQTALALRQGDAVYRIPIAAGQAQSWTTFELATLVEADFESVEGTAIDFSANGEPIQFGFSATLGGSPGHPAGFIDVGIDNWRVIVTSAPAATFGVSVSDDRGGVDSQDFSVLGQLGGDISGAVFADSDSDGKWSRSPALIVSHLNTIETRDLNSGEILNVVKGGAPNFATGPDGELYAADNKTDSIVRFDRVTGVPVESIVRVPEIHIPGFVAFGPNGNLYFSDEATNEIVEVDIFAREVVGTFAGGLANPTGIAFGPDGDLYVAARNRRISRFDGETRLFLGVFATVDATPGGIDFGPDGDLYVAKFENNSVARYDGTTGNFVENFVSAGLGGLAGAFDLEFGPEGDLYVSSHLGHEVLRYNGTSGDFVESVFAGTDDGMPVGIAFTQPRDSANLEAGLSGRAVYLDINGNRVRDPGEPFETSDANGIFAFNDLAPGDYTLRLELSRELLTVPSAASYSVTVEPGRVLYQQNFGITAGDPGAGNEIESTPQVQKSVSRFATVGEKFSFSSTAFDLDGDALSFQLAAAPSGMVVSESTGVVAWVPSEEAVGTHQVVLRISDDNDNVAIEAFEVTVTPRNVNPLFTSAPPLTATAGGLFEYHARAADPDGDDDLLIYQLASGSPPDATINPVSGIVSWDVPSNTTGVVTFTLQAVDQRGAIASQQVALTVLAKANEPPSFDSTPRTAVAVGVPWFYAPTASDPDGEPVTFSLASGPAGLTLTNGVFQWTPSAVGDETVIIEAVDPRGGTVQQTVELHVGNAFQNSAPDITSQPPTAATFDSLFRYRPAATDPDGDSVTWDLLDPPRGVVIDPANGMISWTPDESQLGSQQITLIARDAYGATNTQSFTVDVACTNAHPTIQSLPITNVAVDEAYQYQVVARDPENETLEYFTIQAPNGLTIDAITGVVTWTPMAGQEGLNDVQIGVRDEHQNVATQSYQIDVEAKLTVEQQAERANEPPRILSLPVFRVLPNSTYEYDVQAFDPENGELTYEVTGPAGMAIGADGVVTWNVNRAVDSVVDVRITVTDPLGAKAFQSYQLTVAGNSPPSIVSTPPTVVAAGAIYSHNLRVFDPDGDRINYSVDSDAPISIDDRGRIHWQTTLTDGGLVPVTITATDSHGASDFIQFDLNVQGDGDNPIIETGYSTNVVDFGTSHKFQVRVTDNVEVASVELTFAGQQQTLVDIGDRLEAIITYNRVGIHPVEVVAYDTSGNRAVSNVNFKVDDPNDGEAPRVQITSPTDSQNPGDSIFETSYLTEIHGSVQDDNLVSWTLDYTLASNVNLQIQQELLDKSEIWKNIATGTTAKSNELLGTFDPTMILNNSYIIRLLAHDATGRSRAEGIFVAVTGETKIGNFRLEFTDLSLPLAGIPIDITRVYDTLQADTSGDFGFGWSQGGNDPHILETVPDGAEFAPGKTKVYLTNPEGRRVGFTYTETKILEGLLGDTKYRIEFKPDPGVYDRLTIDQTSITRGGLSGLATSIGQSLGGGGVLMNPDKYTLTTKDGLKYRYDQDAGVKTITDLSGNVVTFTENAITHSSGTAITFDRDDQGRIDLIHFPTTDNDGNTITATIDYDYDANGDLIRFVDQTGKVTSYSYHEDLPHYLAEAKDNQGDRLFKVVYDEDGRYQQVIDIDDNPVQTAEPPDLLARQAIVRDGNDNATTLFFDALGNVEREVDPLGNVTTREYKDPANPFSETKIIDRRGMVTERNYDARGNLKQIMELGPQDAPFAEPVVTQFTYDTGNRVKSITNAAGQTTWFEYDGRGNLTKIVNAVGDFSTFTYDSEGRRASFTDFNGNTTTFDYTNACPCGSPSKVTFADGTYQVFAYNQYGQVTVEQYFEKDGTLAEQKYTFYDIQGRVTHEFDGEFTDGKWNQVRKFYDGDGNLDWEVILSPESTANTGVRDGLFNNLIADLTQTKEQLIAEGKSRVTDYEYDNHNRLIRQIDAEGGVAEFRYDNEGNRILLQDPVGNITTWVYDSLNRVSEERDPFYWENVRASNAVFAGLSNAEWLERIAPIVPVSPLGTDNTRDPLFDDASGASCETNTPAEHVTLSCYDEEGNLTKELDRNGRRRELAYDQAGRLLKETWYAAVTGDLVETISFAYDVLGNMLTATDSHSDYLFTYDVLNRLKSVDNNPNAAVDVPHVILTYGYDKQGNVTRTQDDAGVTVDSEYDARNRLAVRTWYDADVPAGEEADVDPARVDMLYNAAGRMTEMLRFSDLEASNQVGNTRRTYDLSGRSNTITHADAADSLIASYDYDYDFAGLLDFETRGHQDAQYAQTIKYQYDLTGQLTDVDYLEDKQPDEYYRYDANGNRVDSYLHGTGYVTGTANQLMSDGTYNYKYDGEGNLVLKTEIATGEVTIYGYDHRNRMVRVTVKASEQSDVILTEVEYTYDALDRRIARTANGDTVYFFYNGDNVWVDHKESGESISRYLYGSQIDENVARFGTEQNTIWNHWDRLKSVRDFVDVTGMFLGHVDYATYGIAYGPAVPANRHMFMSREQESLHNSYFYRAREYDPGTGIFLAPDPIGFGGQDFNLYRFVSNSPVNGLDPTGTSFLSPAIIVGVVTFAYAPIVSIVVCRDDTLGEFVQRVLLLPFGAILSTLQFSAGVNPFLSGAAGVSLDILSSCFMKDKPKKPSDTL